jgi:transcription elongation factor GreA
LSLAAKFLTLGHPERVTLNTLHGPIAGRVFQFRVGGSGRSRAVLGFRTEEEMVTVSDTLVTWLTQEAFDRLKHELDELIANRPLMASEINARREEGDLRENGGYHAAREEQGKQEARIRQLQELLRGAKVGEAPKDSGIAEPGMVLTVRYEGDSETEKFLLATREEGAHGGIEVYSPASPLGRALLGAREGESRQYELPNGSTQKVTLISATPYAS